MNKIFQIVSDIHLEKNCSNVVFKKLLFNNASELIIAGDLITFNRKNKIKDFFEVISSEYNNIYYVLGNHEFLYSKHNFNDTINAYYDITTMFKNVHLLNDNFIVNNSLKIYGTTLWTNPFDHNKETKNNERYNIINELHNKSKELILQEDNIDILITHHLPSYTLIDKKYENFTNKHLYASSSDDLIKKCKIFIHGHTHKRHDKIIDNVNVICNPYVNEKYFKNKTLKF